MTPAERIEGLRNLRTGYDLVAAVGFWKSLHGDDLIEEYAALVARCEEMENCWLAEGERAQEAERRVALLEESVQRSNDHNAALETALREIATSESFYGPAIARAALEQSAPLPAKEQKQ